MDPTFAAIALVVLAGSYGLSLWRNPDTTCRRCNGNSSRRGWLYFWSIGYCGACGGSGKKTRLGRRLYNSWTTRRRR